MESSYRDRSSSRMDASAASHQQVVAAHHQDRRRHLITSGKAGSGRRRRRPSGDNAPFSATSSSSDARMDASSASYNVTRGGSRGATRLDSSSGYSNNGSVGFSHRRESGSSNNNLLSRDLSSKMHSSGSVMHASGSSGMDLFASAQKHSYNQKLKAAQKLSEGEHHNHHHHQATRQRAATGSRRQTSSSRRRCSVGANSAAGEEGGMHGRGSRSPTNKPHKQRQLSDKYNLIGRVGGGGGRRQSVDSAVSSTMDGSSNNDAASVRSHSISPQGERRLRTRDRIIPPRNSSSDNAKRSEKSLTATRLKKAFSADEFPATPEGGRSGNRSPARGVRRQTSLQNAHIKGPPSRRMVERKLSATESITTNKVSRRSSLPSPPAGGSENEGGSSGLMMRKQQQQQQHHQQQQQEHPRQRQPQDMASRTPKLKSKLQASMDVQAVLDTSMPSLTALDLSVHTAGKRTSDGCSVFTSNTTDTTPTMADDSPAMPHPLSKAPSISLLVDNAQSHSAIAARSTTDNNEGEGRTEADEELEEASTICDSVGDNYKSANIVVRNATLNDHHGTNGSHANLGDLNKSDPTNGRSMTDMSRSDNSKSGQGLLGHSRLDDSRMGGSRMDGSRMDGSRMASSRRRARSNDDVVPRRRRQSPRERRSTSRGGKNVNRKVDSDRNLRLNSRSRSGERKPQRRATMAGGRTPSRDGRGNASSSSLFKDEFGRKATAGPALQRSQTTTSNVRQKSSKSLQRSRTMTTESTKPRRQKSASNLHRQKSASSIRSANSKTSTARGKSKKKKAKSMMSESLGQLETTWVRGSADGKKDLQTQANKALSQITAERKANKNPSASRSSTASVGSMESRNSRLNSSARRKGPPRRSMSIGSVSVASQESAEASKRTSPVGCSSSSKDVPEQRESDATWSLADIDLDDGLSKPNNDTDPDSSIATPPTVSSSSAGEKTEEETPCRKRVVGVRRTQSAGTNYAAGHGRNRPQQSQKSLSSTLTRKSQTDMKRAFSIKYGATHTADPFEMDPFQDQEKDKEIQGDPFESSLHDPFTANDPFGLSKPYQIQKLNVLGQPTKTDEGSTDDDSFHMTNDFGDFGHNESFGSVSFDDNSQDFAVVPIEEATHAARSLLG